MDYNQAMPPGHIARNVAGLLAELPSNVTIVAAAKTRSPAEIVEAVEAGIDIIGENHINEARAAYEVVGKRAQWHLIGTPRSHGMRRKAIEILDMIETIGSLAVAAEIDRRCGYLGKTMPVLIEVNSGREPQKSGVFPDEAAALVEQISSLTHVRVMGLMTMGPVVADAHHARPYFAETRSLFLAIRRLGLPNVDMKHLSMGMSDSYRVAVEEGATMVRIGTGIFGHRPKALS